MKKCFWKPLALVHKLEHSLTATTFYKKKTYSGSFRCHSGSFRSIPPHSGSFRFISVFSNARTDSLAFSTSTGDCPGGFTAAIWGTSPGGTAVSFGLGVSYLRFLLAAVLLSVSMRQGSKRSGTTHNRSPGERSRSSLAACRWLYCTACLLLILSSISQS